MYIIMRSKDIKNRGRKPALWVLWSFRAEGARIPDKGVWTGL